MLEKCRSVRVKMVKGDAEIDLGECAVTDAFEAAGVDLGYDTTRLHSQK